MGWLIAPRESAALAEQLIEASCQKQNVDKNQLTLHADRGPSMTSQTVAQLLARLSITKSHSRPYTSNDNPFSEAMFKTLKYRPEFPERFGAPEDAIGFGRSFFPWYKIRASARRDRLSHPGGRSLRTGGRGLGRTSSGAAPSL